jgi:proline iminopeptidase
VVLHGGPDFDHAYLLPELDGLASAARLVYYDQRGRGRSSSDVTPEDVTIDSEIEDLDRLREHLGLERVSLLGHSWGGLLAMEYAARHPDRLERLVLLNIAPGSHTDRQLTRERRERTEVEALAKMRAIAETAAFTEGDVATEAEYYRAHFGATVRDPELLDQIVGRLRVHFTPADILKARAIENRLYDQTWNRPEYDVVARLRGLAAPTLVLHGEHDLIPAECARHAAEAVERARFFLLEDCGHFSYLERPAEVFAEIAALLAR